MSGDHNMNQTSAGWRKRQIALDKKAENARELGLDYEPVFTYDQVKAHIRAAMLSEREACAKVCEELVPDMSRTTNDASVWDVATFDCAEAIRARNKT